MDTLKSTELNIGADLPPKQEGNDLETETYSCFGFSLQGSSHMAGNIPCQDYNDFRYIEDADILIAAVSDGVGSCPLSHWGSFTAVNAAMDYTEKEIRELSGGRKLELTDEDTAKRILNAAFGEAVNAVEDLAESQNRPVSALMATLTLAVYDGSHLFCEHVGDDGVVVQFMDGSIEMITQRVKGEEANSVYPLQSKKSRWQFSTAGMDERGSVAAFLMATDGVLDAFVMNDTAYMETEGCCNGVFYPFMEHAVYSDDRKDGSFPRKAKEALSYYIERMNSKSYREKVTDDLTVLSVVNPEYVKQGMKPEFDKNIFNTVTQAIRRKQRELLYPSGSAVPEEPEVSDPDEEPPEKPEASDPDEEPPEELPEEPEASDSDEEPPEELPEEPEAGDPNEEPPWEPPERIEPYQRKKSPPNESDMLRPAAKMESSEAAKKLQKNLVLFGIAVMVVFIIILSVMLLRGKSDPAETPESQAPLTIEETD